jgi:hypothetical protein
MNGTLSVSTYEYAKKATDNPLHTHKHMISKVATSSMPYKHKIRADSLRCPCFLGRVPNVFGVHARLSVSGFLHACPCPDFCTLVRVRIYARLAIFWCLCTLGRVRIYARLAIFWCLCTLGNFMHAWPCPDFSLDTPHGPGWVCIGPGWFAAVQGGLQLVAVVQGGSPWSRVGCDGPRPELNPLQPK